MLEKENSNFSVRPETTQKKTKRFEMSEAGDGCGADSDVGVLRVDT